MVAGPRTSTTDSPARHSVRSVALAATTGILLTLCYPPFAQPWLAWIAVTPLLLAVDGVGLGAAAGLGWIAGTVGGLGVTGYWIARAAADYFGLSSVVAVAFTVGVIQLFVAPFYVVFAVLVARLNGPGWSVVFVPAALVVCEAARSALVGNAWALLGHSQQALVLMQVTDLTGIAGLSFLLAASAAVVAAMLRDVGAGLSLRAAIADQRRVLATLLAVVALVVGYGIWRLAAPPLEPSLRAVLVQGAVGNEERRQPGRAAETVQRYVALSAAAPPAAPQR